MFRCNSTCSMSVINLLVIVFISNSFYLSIGAADEESFEVKVVENADEGCVKFKAIEWAAPPISIFTGKSKARSELVERAKRWAKSNVSDQIVISDNDYGVQVAIIAEYFTCRPIGEISDEKIEKGCEFEYVENCAELASRYEKRGQIENRNEFLQAACDLKHAPSCSALAIANGSHKSNGTVTKLNAPQVDIKKFEESIPKKATAVELVTQTDDSFPESWPQKWFFETDEFAYWTIKSDPTKTHNQAMETSNKLATELVKREYPRSKYKRDLDFDTTHTEIKKVRGKFVGWRIIRIKQSEIVQNKK